ANRYMHPVPSRLLAEAVLRPVLEVVVEPTAGHRGAGVVVADREIGVLHHHQHADTLAPRTPGPVLVARVAALDGRARVVDPQAPIRRHRQAAPGYADLGRVAGVLIARLVHRGWRAVRLRLQGRGHLDRLVAVVLQILGEAETN